MQILLNIVSTSICYTNQGYVRIYSEVNEQTQIFSIIVEDSSLGLSEEELRSLFVGKSDKNKSKKSKNLVRDSYSGIATSKQLAHALNGDFEIMSF
jgi:hypothetical protein